MTHHPAGNNTSITIRDLYPHLSETELHEAMENFRAYIEVTLRIYESICADPETYARFRALTASSTGVSSRQQGRPFNGKQ